MPVHGPARALWRKSTRSGQNGNCVEVANAAGVVAVRDSKDVPGPVLVLSGAQWRVLMNDVKRGRLDL